MYLGGDSRKHSGGCGARQREAKAIRRGFVIEPGKLTLHATDNFVGNSGTQCSIRNSELS